MVDTGTSGNEVGSILSSSLQPHISGDRCAVEEGNSSGDQDHVALQSAVEELAECFLSDVPLSALAHLVVSRLNGVSDLLARRGQP